MEYKSNIVIDIDGDNASSSTHLHDVMGSDGNSYNSIVLWQRHQQEWYR